MRKIIIAAVAVVALAGCGGKPVAVQPAATATATVTASPSPTVSRTPATLTREQAAQRYLQVVKPYNDATDDAKCRAIDDFYVLSGGSWPPNDHHDWDEQPEKVARACFKRLTSIMDKEIKDLQTTAWPTDALGDIADLISLNQAYLHCFKQGGKAITSQAVYDTYDCIPKDDDSADRVRARVGLPGRTT
jgi:predicted small lipoprotein YifL